MKVGVYDSGPGGLSIYKEMQAQAPTYDYIYFCDNRFAPYGEKNQSDIIKRAKVAVEKLCELECQMVVVACNTATAYAIDYLRDNFDLPFIGVEPYLKYGKRPGENPADYVVLVTPSMANSTRFLQLKHKVDPEGQMTIYPCPYLATQIERRGPSREQLEREFSGLDTTRFRKVILGCTHYPLAQKKLEDFLALEAINPAREVAAQFCQVAGRLDAKGVMDERENKCLKVVMSQVDDSLWGFFCQTLGEKCQILTKK